MVFEAIVVELLNKFLKQYVENLDTSQLKIGIWGGDVVLKDLKLRTTLFDDLDVPLKVKWGKLGKLAMKIPWKNLYGSHVVVDIEELLMVVVPDNEFKYDPVKEAKWAEDKKQARLKAVEEAKKREMEADSPKQGDGFVEKLLTQIIKNIQVTIRNIHVRYEDKTTIPGSPFSIGVAMSNLSAQTTVNDPNASFSKLLENNENFICKVVDLEGLAIYWNSSSVLFSELPWQDLLKALLESIPNANYKPPGFTYLFGPMRASAFLRLNSKPENDGSNFTIPKIFVNVHLREIDLAVTHKQFSDAMKFLQDFERLFAASKYKKYRPTVPVIGHVKEWWLFAYNSVAEEIIKHKKEWCWENIKNHRQMCRKYSELFNLKLNSKKLPVDLANELRELEKNLNVFNLILIREQVYVEVERNNLKKIESKSVGWFSGWFGYGSDPTPDSENEEIVKKLEKVMTAQEKQKLYKAIGYKESAPPTNYPPSFVEFQFWFHLDEIKMTVFDDRLNPLVPIMTLSIKDVRMEFEQRPSAFAMKLVMIIGNFQVIGKKAKDETYPELVTSNCTESESLMEILYETKPLSASCDQRVKVNARPLRIIYHAETINVVREVFTTETSDEMSRVVAATSASLPTFQKMTAFGLQYAIENRTVLELEVNIMPSYLIIPFGGVYNPKKEMLVLMFGKLKVETNENEQKDVSVRKLYLEGTTDEEIFSTVVSASYTDFKCQLSDVQILLQLAGEDWVRASKVQGTSPLRFLESVDLGVTVKKSLVTDDARIPKMIIEGKLPSLTFNFSEERLVGLAALVCSIPTKTAEKQNKLTKKDVSGSTWSLQSLGNQLESKLVHIQKEVTSTRLTEYVQAINLVGHFEMNELMVIVSKTKDSQKSEANSKPIEEKFLNLRVNKLEVELTSKTFETINLLKLGGIEFKQYHHKKVLPFVKTKSLENDYYLFVMEYVNLDPKAPDFYTEREAIVNRLTLNISPLNMVLNREALLAQRSFVRTVQSRLNSIKDCYTEKVADAGKLKEPIYEEGSEGPQADKKVISKGKRFRKKLPQKEVIDIYLEASLEEIDFAIEHEGQGIAEFTLKGASLNLSTRKSYTTVYLKLREISLLDLSPLTLHRQIVGSLDKQTLSSQVTVYNSEYFGAQKSVDMSCDAEVGGLRFIFVNAFFSRAMEFLSAFQPQIETLKEGATVAAQKAKENVMKAYENAAQICLNVNITAPLLVIPKSSVSLEVLVVDLGVLTIKNNITEVDYSSEAETETRPMIDTMRFHLQNLKVSRCQFVKNSTNFENEKNFLVPVTFEMTIKRNLSTGWFRVIPKLEILARLAAVHVTFSHDDLCAIMSTIRENLAEGSRPVSSKSSRPHESPEGEKKTHRERHYQVLTHADETERNESSDFYTVVKFMFYMDRFVFDATTDENKDDTSQSVGLARFVLETISLKGRTFSDYSIHTAILLVSCLVDDMRPGKGGRLRRLMERTNDHHLVDYKPETNEANPVNSMVEIIFQRKDLDTFVDIRVYKFTLILSMDFLQKLGGFFTLEDIPPSGPSGPSERVKRVKAVEKRLTMNEEESERPPTFTINLRLEKPDIAIVENMDSINTDALIFHTEMVMKYRTAGTRKVLSGALNDIELYSCCFNPEKRRHTMFQVIKPFTISVAGSTPPGHGFHVDICLTEIAITINPNTVQLIAKCYEALASASSVSDSDVKEKVYSDLWEVKSFNPDDYWFLKLEEGVDVLSAVSSISSGLSVDEVLMEEICLLAIPSISIFVEEIPSKHSKPFFLVRMGFQMQCHNWSTKMNINNTLTLEVQYYNKIISAWEPLIEPVENVGENRKHSYVPWELNCSVVFGDEGDLDGFQPPKMSVSLTSEAVLQVTVTKTCVDLLKTAVETYNSAVSKGVIQKEADHPPYVIKNETGIVVELLLEKSGLQVCKAFGEQYRVVKLESNSEVELQDQTLDYSVMNRSFYSGFVKKEAVLHVTFPLAKSAVYGLPLEMNSKQYFPINLEEFDKGEVWGLVSEVTIKDSTTRVFLRSVLKVFNYFVEPINIHSLSENGTEAELVGTVDGNSGFSLPFHAAYNSRRKFFFSVNGYSLSIQSFAWAEIVKELKVSTLLQCNSKTPESNDPFFIQLVGEAEQICYANTNRKTVSSMCYNIHLQPTLKVFNSLPVPLVICCQGNAREKLLQPGNYLQITNAEPGASTITMRIDGYLEKEWSCKETIQENPPEFSIWKFISYNGLAPETLNLGVHCTYKRQTAVYAIYCPYFMINKTDRLLSYKFDGTSTVFYHPHDFHLPVMFSPSSRKFFSKKSAYLQVDQSCWSDKFPVDVAGSGGTVVCEDGASNVTYKISVSISLTYNGLTRIILFTPFYVFLNEADYAIECQEQHFLEYPWLEIPAKSCLPFWPKSQEKQNAILVRPKGSPAASPPFGYESTDSCLLRLAHKHGGIFVAIQATQSGTYVTFDSYEPGQAPVLIINHSAKVIKLYEEDTKFSVTLKPLQKIMHAWVAPKGSRKLILMNPKHHKDVIVLDEDTDGLVFTAKGESVRYLSFLDGTQRTLLFTEDKELSSQNFGSRAVVAGIEVICKIHGIGISLVSNLCAVEILYMSCMSSAITWEMKKKGRMKYKTMNADEALELENEYSKYLEESETKSDVNPVVEVGHKYTVNFETMEMTRPRRRELRRTFEPGVWLAYRVMDDQVMLHVKINRIQIDNQLLGCVFPVILAPVPPPKTVVAMHHGPKPFFELSIVKIAADRSGVEQYKYFKILIQEFHVKIDIILLQQFWMFLTVEEMAEEEEKSHFKRDLELTQKPLISHVEVISSNEQKNFYDLLHFSPLKIHFSFSLGGNFDGSSLPPLFGVMFQSLGVTLTDVHDVVFRLSYFERKCIFLTRSQLTSEVISHYYGQIIRQAYVLLLGLDVIGNPYGLIVGIGEGVEAFFYEPFQGIIQGPSDFATGVAIGCKSLFGHTVGSTAGTLGKLTATLGKGLAVLSLDKEFQIQRMESQNRQENIQTSMARGGRGLVMGVFEGVTGVVKKPLEGAKEDGVGGFFKGMGKGMMGLVTRPVTGVVDFASTSLNAIKRAVEANPENKRIRPPRFFRDERLVQPYDIFDAEGNAIFYAICKRKYCPTDRYEFHAELRGKEVVVLTNKRIILAELNEACGTWQEHMVITWRSMPERPHCHTKGVALTMPRRPGSIKKEKPEVKVLLVDDPVTRKTLCEKMVELYQMEKTTQS